MVENLSIGQASKLCNISVQTLRYYDNIGLVKPSYVNPDNGYRYYTNREIIRIKIIQNLREFDFALEVIAKALDNDSLTVYENLLKDKKHEFEMQRCDIDRAIEKLETKIQSLNYYKDLSSSAEDYFEVRQLPSRTVISAREYSPCTFESMTGRFTKLLGRTRELKLDTKEIISILAVYHEDILTFDRKHADIEVCMQYRSDYINNKEITNSINGGSFLIGIYRGTGTEELCKNIYKNMLGWISNNCYKITGPVVEEYIVNPLDIHNEANYITEIQVPIIRIKSY